MWFSDKGSEPCRPIVDGRSLALQENQEVVRMRVKPLVGAGVGLLVLSGLFPSIAAGRTTNSGGQMNCPASPPTVWGLQWVACHLGGQGFTSPAVGTIDGTKVVVDASLSGWVYVWNARSGHEMPGWPQPADLVGRTPTAIDASPAIAYLDGPGREPSIVVGLGSSYIKYQNGGVMAWHANGTVRFRFRTKHTFLQWGKGPARYSNSVFATPAIGDITGSGQKDIVFGSFDHYVYALRPNGKVVKGFPIARLDTIWSSAALADTSHTGKMDIIEGGDANGWPGPKGGAPCYSGWISDYRYTNGAPRLVWERCLRETVWSSPAVTTFGRTPVVVVGTSWFYGPGRHTMPDKDELFAFNALTGHMMPGWPVQTGGPSFGSPAIAPPRPGAAPEVIASSCAHCTKGPAIVTAWNEKGHRLWRTFLTRHSEQLASPLVGEVTDFAHGGSSVNDVVIGNVAGLFVLNAANGHKVAGTATEPINSSCYVGGTPATAEVPGSRTGYMLFANCGFKGPNKPANEFLRAYNIPAPTAPAPWPMWRANPQRTGVPDPLRSTRKSCPRYRVKRGVRAVTAAGSVIAVGGAPSCGDLGSDLLPEDVAGMAPTSDGGGYWVALGDGAVYAFGDASNEGDLRGDRWSGGPAAPGAPVMGIAAATGSGYYLLAGDGSVYAFGGAAYHGSYGDYRSGSTAVGIASDGATGGYWVADSNGHVASFDAPRYGSSRHGHIVGIAATANGAGYWLVSSSGTVYAFGRARNLGDARGHRIVGITAALSGRGYYLVSKTGEIFSFGSVRRAPSVSRAAGKDPVVAITAI